MNTPIPSKIVMVLAACILCVSGESGRSNAGDKKLPYIGAVSLKEFDASHEIAPDSRPRKAQTLKPRALPGYDALSSVLWSSGSSSAAALLANGADPNATSKTGDPILHYAILCKHREPIEDLLRAGADLNLGDKSGRTPLHWAVWCGHAQTVALLVKYGADPNRKNKSGTTALKPLTRVDTEHGFGQDIKAILIGFMRICWFTGCTCKACTRPKAQDSRCQDGGDFPHWRF